MTVHKIVITVSTMNTILERIIRQVRPKGQKERQKLTKAKFFRTYIEHSARVCRTH